METSDAINDLYAELYERSSVVVELDAAQIEGWTSGLFAAWESDEEALGFVDYCADRPGPVAAVLLSALAELGRSELERRARTGVDAMATHVPPVVQQLGGSQAVQAWSVTAPFGRSLVVGFRSTADADVDHAVLAELDEDGALTDLQLSGAPEDLLAPDSVGTGAIQVESGDVDATLSEIAAAWQRSSDQGVEPTPGIAANQYLVRHRLLATIDVDVSLLSVDDSTIDRTRGMSPAEIAQANAAALSTLAAAVGKEPAGDPHQAWVDVVTANVTALTPREREGLLWLEWADWLGAGIGLVRAGAGTAVDGGVLVDFVNRCPEVSSTVHADDRDYAEWAFDVALDHLVDADLVVDGALTEAGANALHASLIAAWTDVD